MRAAHDLAASEEQVRAAAVEVLTGATSAGVAALRSARAPYPYRYADRIAATATATRPRASKGGDRHTAQVKVGGRSQAFSGGASVSMMVWGAEFGAKGGDVVRVRLSTGRSQTIAARNFTRYARRSQAQWTAVNDRGRRRSSTAGTGEQTRITDVRKGGLPWFPPRRTDGWFLTPALDDDEPRLWSDTDAAFIRALDRG
jgi:hypothetical protein